MPDSLDAKVAVLEQTTSDLGRRISSLESAMSSVRDDLQSIRDTQTEQLVEQRACGSQIKALVQWTQQRDEDERTEVRALRQAQNQGHQAWQSWLRQTFDARTIAIILAIIAGFFGVQINTAGEIAHEVVSPESEGD